MKEYTTAEAFALLEKNPTFRFVHEELKDRKAFLSMSKGKYYCYEVEYQGHLTQYNLPAGLQFFGNISTYAKWTLVPQPVPWQEALQARLDGKTVKVDCPDCGGDADSCVFEPTQDKESVCFSALKEGTFYIIEAPID